MDYLWIVHGLSMDNQWTSLDFHELPGAGGTGRPCWGPFHIYSFPLTSEGVHVQPGPAWVGWGGVGWGGVGWGGVVNVFAKPGLPGGVLIFCMR